MKRIVALIILIIGAWACGSGPAPQRDEFAGKWLTEDGGTIVLNEDSTCYVKLPSGAYVIRLCEIAADSVEFSGKWAFSARYFDKMLYTVSIISDSMIYVTEQGFESKIGFDLQVRGENGRDENYPPWYLFRYKGDPERKELYVVRKN